MFHDPSEFVKNDSPNTSLAPAASAKSRICGARASARFARPENRAWAHLAGAGLTRASRDTHLAPALHREALCDVHPAEVRWRLALGLCHVADAVGVGSRSAGENEKG